MQDTAPSKPLSFGFHKKKSPLKKPAASVASVFTQQQDDDDDADEVEALSLQALTVEEIPSPSPAPNSPPAFPRPSSHHHQPHQAPTTAAASLPKVDVTGDKRQASTKQAKADTLREAGNEKAVAGEMRQALALFEEAIGLAPTSSVLFELKSQCHLALEEYVEAVRAARRAVKLAPEWNEGALTLGRALLSLGKVLLEGWPETSLSVFCFVCVRKERREESEPMLSL